MHLDPKTWWYVSRATGFVGWALLAASVLWGLFITNKTLGRTTAPAWVLDLHRHLGGLAVAFVAVHLAVLPLTPTPRGAGRTSSCPMASTLAPDPDRVRDRRVLPAARRRDQLAARSTGSARGGDGSTSCRSRCTSSRRCTSSPPGPTASNTVALVDRRRGVDADRVPDRHPGARRGQAAGDRRAGSPPRLGRPEPATADECRRHGPFPDLGALPTPATSCPRSPGRRPSPGGATANAHPRPATGAAPPTVGRRARRAHPVGVPCRERARPPAVAPAESLRRSRTAERGQATAPDDRSDSTSPAAKPHSVSTSSVC